MTVSSALLVIDNQKVLGFLDAVVIPLCLPFTLFLSLGGTLDLLLHFGRRQHRDSGAVGFQLLCQRGVVLLLGQENKRGLAFYEQLTDAAEYDEILQAFLRILGVADQRAHSAAEQNAQRSADQADQAADQTALQRVVHARETGFKLVLDKELPGVLFYDCPLGNEVVVSFARLFQVGESLKGLALSVKICDEEVRFRFFVCHSFSFLSFFCSGEHLDATLFY